MADLERSIVESGDKLTTRDTIGQAAENMVGGLIPPGKEEGVSGTKGAVPPDMNSTIVDTAAHVRFKRMLNDGTVRVRKKWLRGVS